MGECGCGVFAPDFRFPAPDGDVYLLQILAPCVGCETTVGLVVQRMTRATARKRHGRVQRLPLRAIYYDKGAAEAVVPVLDADLLRTALAQWVEFDEDVHDNSDFARALETATPATLQRWQKTAKRRRRK